MTQRSDVPIEQKLVNRAFDRMNGVVNECQYCGAPIHADQLSTRRPSNVCFACANDDARDYAGVD
jgi:RNA polymerase-binding transcription factor DksA